MTRRAFIASIATAAMVTQVSLGAVKPKVYVYHGVPGGEARRLFERDSGLHIRDVRSVECRPGLIRFEVF